MTFWHNSKDGTERVKPLGVYVENWREIGIDGLCHAEDWMLDYQPDTVLDDTACSLMRLVGINCAMNGHEERAQQICVTFDRYAEAGDAMAKTSALIIRRHLDKESDLSRFLEKS